MTKFQRAGGEIEEDKSFSQELVFEY